MRKITKKRTFFISGIIAALVGWATITIVVSTGGMADSEENLESFLRHFHENPSEVLNRIPKKRNSFAGSEESTFVRPEEGLNFLEAKNGERFAVIKRAQIDKDKGPIGSNENPSEFIDLKSRGVFDLGKMEEQRLFAQSLEIMPWSDHYWPLAEGVIANRYQEDWSGGWDELFELFQENSPNDYVSLRKIDLLSPAEKYDLLVGDYNWTLTKAMWTEGKRYFDAYGKVERWMGICHGWAAASLMDARPRQTIKLMAADGVTEITFYPADIKALSSLLWAKADYKSRFIGGRCNDKDPKKDENGRVISQDCLDSNPATWHFAVVNQIGLAKRGFIMDATYDYEVWNQPVVSYEYTYFNPQTLKQTQLLEKALVPIENFTIDKFKKYRSPRARYVVGISMEVSYLAETMPRNRDTDSEEYDRIDSVTYRYDLELDEDKLPIGGEWYTNFHPDFMWIPSQDARPVDYFSAYLSAPWGDNQAFPVAWTAAAKNSSKYGLPLVKVVDKLLKLGSQGFGP